ncbi:hypothetical protein [Legionella tunisiensis]|uniref:hypothetical protein n=1 Tax=Legionella tunisiensis TaxID=1034944 RepID=UPI001E31F78C|nr:hypothetical protein [Legionella tunisiensis]
MSIWIVICILMTKIFAETTDNPCDGPGAVLNYTHRGAVADSTCVVPAKTFMAEAGYSYSRFSNPAVFIQNSPQLTLTLGLPANTQFVLFVSSFNQQTSYPFSGYGVTQLDMKHQVFITQNGCSQQRLR